MRNKRRFFGIFSAIAALCATIIVIGLVGWGTEQPITPKMRRADAHSFTLRAWMSPQAE